MKTKLFKLITLFICLAVLFSGVLSSAIYVKNDRQKVYDSVIRLHVLANSDSDADQQLKLKVRDELVQVTSSLFKDCKSIAQAKNIATQNLSLLQTTAQQALKKHGCHHDVTINLGTEIYPVRNYGEFVFPAGEYFSLRVCIGEAKGKNWWCVLFPPLCSSAYIKSTKEDIELLQKHGFDEQLTNSLLNKKNQKTVIKFKLFDIF